MTGPMKLSTKTTHTNNGIHDLSSMSHSQKLKTDGLNNINNNNNSHSECQIATINNNNNNNNSNNNFDDKSSKSAQALLEVRRRFIEYAEKNPDKVNERDKQKLANDDWYLKRYLLARNRKVDETMKMLMKTMEWRNEFGLHISEDAMFPLEFYKIGALFPYENDKDGNLVLYLRIKYHRKVEQMVEVEKHFLVHTFEKIDRITNGQGLVIVFDCQGAGYANCDIEFLQFLISCATEHAPVGLKYLIVYKLPWVLNAFWSLARKLLPAYLANRIRFCDEKSVTEYIQSDKLPDFMGGCCRRNYRWIPPGCPSVFKLANAYGISDAEIEKILPQFQELLDDAEETLARNTYDDPPETITRYLNNSETAPSLLSDYALVKVGKRTGLVPMPEDQKRQKSTEAGDSFTKSTLRVFPGEFIEFKYDAYNDTFYGSLTILNSSKTNSLAFKIMSNCPSSYSVKPARGTLSPDASITLTILLLNEHKASDKFLVLGQIIEGDVSHTSKTEFDSLWSSDKPRVVVKVGSYIRNKLAVSTSQFVGAIKSPHIQELSLKCKSLQRRQNFLLFINVTLLIILINMVFFNHS